MAQYVTVPTEEESRLRRAEVASMLADTAQRTVGGQRWWQRFETDVELGGLQRSPRSRSPAGRSSAASSRRSSTAIVLPVLWGLLVGLAAPFVTRFIVTRRVSKKRKAFEEQLPDNLDVLAGAMRTGHSTMGALSVMVDSADEPSKSEFRRVLQDEQLGVPLDDALMVMARRMQSYDAEQIALVMRLQREAGGNTAEVLDRVAEVIRGRMELRRLVERPDRAGPDLALDPHRPPDLRARWLLVFTGGDYLDPMIDSLVGADRARRRGRSWSSIGSFWIKQIVETGRVTWVSELIAVAGVLLLGAGVMILVVNLGKAPRLPGDARPDPDVRLRRRGDAAARRRGSAARRPLDSLAGRLGDLAARRLEPVRRGEDPREARLRGHVRHDAAQDPRLPGPLRDRVLARRALAHAARWAARSSSRSLLAVAAGVVGWFAPVYYVELKRRQRMEQIDKQMPDMIDLLVVTIEAGLGILASMRVASESMSDPLGQELRLTLQEQRMGLSVSQAIESLGRRADCAEHADLRSRRSPRASGSASRSGRRCGTSRSRCASGAGRWPRSGRRRCRSRCSSRSSSSSSRRSSS